MYPLTCLKVLPQGASFGLIKFLQKNGAVSVFTKRLTFARAQQGSKVRLADKHPLAKGQRSRRMDAASWKLVALLAVPHVLYAVVWLAPSRVTRLANLLGRKEEGAVVALFARVAVAIKVLQVTALAAWAAPVRWSDSSPAVWALGAALLCVGQVLNVAVYKALGQKGVYYGAPQRDVRGRG